MKYFEFEKLCTWLETDAELHSLSEVHEKMVELSGNGQVYTKKWLKREFHGKYNNDIYFAEFGGRSDIVLKAIQMILSMIHGIKAEKKISVTSVKG